MLKLYIKAETIVSTTEKKGIYYKLLAVFGFVLNTGHGISLANYDIFYIKAFDLMSTHQASNGFIQTESTNCTFSVELKLDAGLAHNVGLLFMRERASTIYVRSDRKNTKNTLMV